MYLRISRARENGTFSFSFPGTPDPVKKNFGGQIFCDEFLKEFFQNILCHWTRKKQVLETFRYRIRFVGSETKCTSVFRIRNKVSYPIT
jgi:hypothetical protein